MIRHSKSGDSAQIVFIAMQSNCNSPKTIFVHSRTWTNGPNDYVDKKYSINIFYCVSLSSSFALLFIIFLSSFIWLLVNGIYLSSVDVHVIVRWLLVVFNCVMIIRQCNGIHAFFPSCGAITYFYFVACRLCARKSYVYMYCVVVASPSRLCVTHLIVSERQDKQWIWKVFVCLYSYLANLNCLGNT